MKKRITTAFAIACMMLLSGVLTACGGDVKIKLSTENNVTTLKPGESTQIIMDVENEDVVLAIVDGEEYATLSSEGVLTIKTDALAGEEVTTVAKLDDKVVSNELTITVGAIALTSLEATANKTEVQPGGTARLSYVATPNNSNENIEWKIIEGATLARISENTLIINDDATVGATIKVKAQADSMASNELTFTVAQASTEILYITANDEYMADADAPNATNIIIKVWKGIQEVTDKTIEFTVVSEGDFVALREDGYTCGITVIGHGTAKVRASIAGTSVYKDITVNCIKAPDQILAPAALVGKSSVISTGKGPSNAISNFKFQIDGTNACQDVAYTFEKYSSGEYATTQDVTLEDGVLTFANTGKYRVTATSTSGGVRTPARSIEFDVNEGVNVSTYESFKTNVETGNVVNIINMSETGDSQDYDLIPDAILRNTLGANPTYDEVCAVRDGIKVRVESKNVIINGNGYKLDLSGLKYYDVENKTGEGDKYFDWGNLITVTCTQAEKTLYDPSDDDENSGNKDLINEHKRTNLTKADYVVNINNLDITGSASVGGSIGDKVYDPTGDEDLSKLGSEFLIVDQNDKVDARLRSCFHRAMCIGDDGTFVPYQITIDNMNVSGFGVGLRLSHAVNSKVSNVYVGNCFSNGIEISASKITFENMTYGLCGAAGIEITPDSSGYAGLDFSSNQEVVFSGSISTSNVTDGTTPYMALWVASGATEGLSIANVIQGSMIASLGKNPFGDYELSSEDYYKISNVTNGNGQIAFIALIFNGEESNQSKLSYTNVDGGIINFNELEGVDTTHEYIQLDILNNLGSALLYNVNMYNSQN